MHPVPQNIMQVEFQLFGSLTIREFTIIAAGGIFAFIIYTSSLPFILKWPLILLFAGGGIAIAKYKINDRNLEVYISSFVNAMMSPQKMVWRKGKKRMSLFEEREKTVQSISATKFVKNGLNIEDLNATTLSRVDSSNLSDDERRLSELIQDMYSQDNANSDSPTKISSKISISQPLVNQTSSAGGGEADIVKNSSDKNMKIDKTKGKTDVVKTSPEGNEEVGRAEENLTSESVKDDLRRYEPNLPNKGQIFDSLLGVNDEEITRKVRKQQIELEKQYESKTEEESSKRKQKKEADIKSIKEKASRGHAFGKATKPTFEQEKVVTKPNIITGFVRDSHEKLLDGAVIIIKDSESDRTVRSMITNPLGHFSHTSSLKNGEYTINIYKDGHNFKPVKVTLDGKVLEPINITE